MQARSFLISNLWYDLYLMDIMYAYSPMAKLAPERHIQWYASFTCFNDTDSFFWARADEICRIVSFKTGPNNATKENWGVNYRALNDLFEISQNRSGAIAYEVGAQMVEIYNEQVRDLLSSNASQKKYPFELCIVLLSPNCKSFFLKYLAWTTDFLWYIPTSFIPCLS